MSRALRNDSGQALIEGLLALGLVALVVAVGVQAFAFAHARSVAIAAAQDGAETAATTDPAAGGSRADALLRAAGGIGTNLHASSSVNDGEVTVTVSGAAPGLFPLGLFLPNISVSASVPVEQYPADQARP